MDYDKEDETTEGNQTNMKLWKETLTKTDYNKFLQRECVTLPAQLFVLQMQLAVSTKEYEIHL